MLGASTVLDSAAIAGFHQMDHHEEADAYPAVIWTGVHIRIVACRHGIQWIVQNKGGSRRGSTRWRSMWHCATRRGVERFLPRVQAVDEAAFNSWLAEQPIHFPRTAKV